MLNIDSDISSSDEPVKADTAVGKALLLLDALGSGRAAEPLLVLAARTGMPKSTACRILRTMEQREYVARKGSLYCLGPRMTQLGRVALVSTHDELRTVSAAPLERLFDEVRTTVHLGVLAGTEVLYLEKITAPGGSRIPTRVGAVLPALGTALGKAQLAFTPAPPLDELMSALCRRGTARTVRNMPEFAASLNTVRLAGIAHDREEFRPGLSCVAAPVLVRGRAVAAVSASSTTSPAYTAQRSNAVKEAARRIGHKLTMITRER